MGVYKLLDRKGSELEEIIASSLREAESVGRERFTEFSSAREVSASIAEPRRRAATDDVDLELAEGLERLSGRDGRAPISHGAALAVVREGALADEYNATSLGARRDGVPEAQADLVTTSRAPNNDEIQWEVTCPRCRGTHMLPTAPTKFGDAADLLGRQRMPCGKGEAFVVDRSGKYAAVSRAV